MKDAAPALVLRQRRDAQALRDPAGAGHVRLDYTDLAPLDQPVEVGQGRLLLAGGEQHIDRVGELGIARVVVRWERLLDPVRAALAHAPGALDRIRVLAPAETAVDH